ncbi:hypothetical protein DSO57_1028289 [Entomophthora muscae]|uniref:Uncharacterized protein n=1 Tax=Entomophthora muscae TaxID=34485 RepID=A0ACC2TP02_9FUNG|nr:hypothetical protein DSO57_1028289 [Entomophthora muscae]
MKDSDVVIMTELRTFKITGTIKEYIAVYEDLHDQAPSTINFDKPGPQLDFYNGICGVPGCQSPKCVLGHIQGSAWRSCHFLAVVSDLLEACCHGIVPAFDRTEEYKDIMTKMCCSYIVGGEGISTRGKEAQTEGPS